MPDEHSRTNSSAGTRAGIGGLLLGIGFGGLFDGVVLHQILQWHHLLSSTGSHPTDTVAGLEANTLADGLFHAFTAVSALAGIFMLWRATQAGAVPTARELIGTMLIGWGAFNLVEGLVNHQILTLHHVNGDNVVLWDTAFLTLGAALIGVGYALLRSSVKPDRSTPGPAASAFYKSDSG